MGLKETTLVDIKKAKMRGVERLKQVKVKICVICENKYRDVGKK
jgi:hypothetical protein